MADTASRPASPLSPRGGPRHTAKAKTFATPRQRSNTPSFSPLASPLQSPVQSPLQSPVQSPISSPLQSPISSPAPSRPTSPRPGLAKQQRDLAIRLNEPLFPNRGSITLPRPAVNTGSGSITKVGEQGNNDDDITVPESTTPGLVIPMIDARSIELAREQMMRSPTLKSPHRKPNNGNKKPASEKQPSPEEDGIEMTNISSASSSSSPATAAVLSSSSSAGPKQKTSPEEKASDSSVRTGSPFTTGSSNEAVSEGGASSATGSSGSSNYTSNNGWDDLADGALRDWLLECMQNESMHTSAMRFFQVLRYALGLPSAVLSALSSSAVLAIVTMANDGPSWQIYGAFSMSILATILTTIYVFCGFETLEFKHARARASYRCLVRRMRNEIMLDWKTRTRRQDVFAQLSYLYEDVSNDTDDIPAFIVRRHKAKLASLAAKQTKKQARSRAVAAPPVPSSELTEIIVAGHGMIPSSSSGLSDKRAGKQKEEAIQQQQQRQEQHVIAITPSGYETLRVIEKTRERNSRQSSILANNNNALERRTNDSN